MRLIEYQPDTIAKSFRGRLPITDTIIPLDGRGRRKIKSISDEVLIANVRLLIDSRNLKGKTDLQKADGGLYAELKMRTASSPSLFQKAGLASRYRDWDSLSDDELVKYTLELMRERGITGKWGLRCADSGAYRALLKREKTRPGIMSRVGFERKHIDWAFMDDEEVVARAKEFMSGAGLCGKSELLGANRRLYDELYQRERKTPGIMGRVGFEEKHRDWNSMGNGMLVAFSKGFLERRGIGRRKDLEKADLGLYKALWKRDMLDAVFSDVESSNHKEAVDGVLDALGSFGDEK